MSMIIQRTTRRRCTHGFHAIPRSRGVFVVQLIKYNLGCFIPLFSILICFLTRKDPQRNEAWSLNSNGTITGLMSGKCLDRSNYGTTPGTQVLALICN